MANRLETTSRNGKIHISKETKNILGDKVKIKQLKIKEYKQGYFYWPLS